MKNGIKQFLLFCGLIASHILLDGMDQTAQFLMPAARFIIDSTPAFSECTNQNYILARIKGKEVGRVNYSHLLDTHITFMHRLSVNPEFRKRGIATALVKACIRQAKNNHKKTLMWEAMPLEANLSLDQLIHIYKKLIHTIDPNLQLSMSEPYGLADVKKVNMRIEIGLST